MKDDRITVEELRQIEKEQGAEEAYNLLLLGGYDSFAGSVAEYDELLKELESDFYWGR